MTYETIRCWCDKFGKGFSHRVKAARRKPGSTWHLDEMFVTLRGGPYLLWRAVDEHGTARSGNISRSSGICCALRSTANNSQRASLHGANSPKSPKIRALLSDHSSLLTSYRLTLDKLTMPERRARGFREPKRTQKFLWCLGPIPQHFAAQGASAARFTSSQTARHPVR